MKESLLLLVSSYRLCLIVDTMGRRSRGGNVKPSVLLLTLISSLCLLNACGGGGSSSGGGGGNLAATHFSVTAPATASGGSNFNITVTALDAANNLATGYSGTVHFSSSDAQALLPNSSSSELVDGTGTFTVALQSAGKQTITVTDQSNPTITGVTGSITVALVATSLGVYVHTPRNPSDSNNFPITAGTPLNFTVAALDGSGEPFPGYSGTVSFTSTDGQAALPLNSTLAGGTGTFSATLETDGSQTITATDTATASITGISMTIHVLAPASGFTPTGNMQTTREDHTATLLNDGRVLVAGGMHWAWIPDCPQSMPACFQLNALASAEIFDPAKGAFTSTGEMSVVRVFHTATLLGNGKVLVAGGDNRYGTTYSTAELYDPATGVFTLIRKMMTTERSGHTATLLANGKVLLAGGAGVGGSSPTAEVFDPTTEEFTPTGSMSVGRFFFTATLLNDGRVLLAGGDGGGNATAELFDPATNTFTVTGSMSVERSAHAATLLTSGEVLVTGGATLDGVTATAELFDPVTGTFALTRSMLSPRELHTATRLTDGKVLVTGGIDKNGTAANIHYLATAEMFDPANGTFTAAGNMEIERSAHAAILLLNGEVLITGGINADNAEYLNSLASAELFP